MEDQLISHRKTCVVSSTTLSQILALSLVYAFPTWADAPCTALSKLEKSPVSESEIVSLPLGGALTSQVLEDLSGVEIAEKLVGRVANYEKQHRLPTVIIPAGLPEFQIHQQFGSIYQSQTPRVPIDYSRDSQIIIQFKPDKIPLIGSGFGNVHEGHRSMGGTTVERGEDHDSIFKTRRADIEDEILGVKIPRGNTKANFLRPKSGWLHIHGVDRVGELIPISVKQYGPLGAVGKRHLQDRALWVTGDSLRSLRGKNLSSSKDLQGWFSNIGGNSMLHLGTFRTGEFPFLFSYVAYIEVLTFGPIEIKDIDHFTVDVTDGDIPDKWASDLGRYNKWVFVVHRENQNSRPVLKYEKALFRGSETPLEVPSRYQSVLE